MQHIEHGDVSMVRRFLENGTDIHANATDNAKRLGYTPLVWAVSKFQPRVVELLLDWKPENTQQHANVEERTAWGASPLSLTCWHPEQPEHAGRNVEIARILIEKGNADVNGLTSKGWTPLFHAAAHCEKELIELLVEKGAWLHNFEKHSSEYEYNAGSDEKEMATESLQDFRMIVEEAAKEETRRQATSEKAQRCRNVLLWVQATFPRVVPIPAPGEKANVEKYVPKEKWHWKHDEL